VLRKKKTKPLQTKKQQQRRKSNRLKILYNKEAFEVDNIPACMEDKTSNEG